MWNFPLFPDQASSHASHVDLLYLFELAVSVAFIVLICAMILGFAVRYRRGTHVDRSNPAASPAKCSKLPILSFRSFSG